MVSEHLGPPGDGRRRVYARRFSYAEARARAKAGETFASIAKALGVDRRTISRVVKLPEAKVREATPEEMERAAAMPSDRIPCPRCTGPMSIGAELCRDCRNELRLLPMTVRPIPGSTGRVELRSVEAHRIVEWDGRYGMTLGSGSIPSSRSRRLVDTWDAGVEMVNNRTLVKVLPASEILVGGEPELPEEIGL